MISLRGPRRNNPTDERLLAYRSPRIRRSIRLAFAASLLTLILGTWHPVAASPGSEQCVDLVKAKMDGDVEFWLSGTGDSREVKLEVRNELTVSLELCVEVGTKLTPKDAGVQSMVVTTKVKISLKPKAEEKLTLDVACLDISKDPPAEGNTSWTIQRLQTLVDFLQCVNSQLDAAIEADPANAKQYEQIRATIVQFALWKARGASYGEWIEFWTKYQHMKHEDAEALVEALDPLLSAIVQECGSLKNL